MILFIFAAGLIGSGAYLLLLCLAHPSVYGLLRGGGIAIIFLGLGTYLLWDDFVRPRLRRPNG